MKEETQQAKAAVARERSQVYGFLAAVFRKELTSEFLGRIRDPHFLGVLAELGVKWENGFIDKPETELLDELAVEYAHLFLGPGRHISPHESVHRPSAKGESGRLWGDATVEVKRFIEIAGFQYQEGYRGLPDHISVELEFMEQLTLSESEAWGTGHEEKVHYCRDIQRRFISDHLARWVPAFCDRVAEQAEWPFYRDLAGLVMRFIELEKQEMTDRQASRQATSAPAPGAHESAEGAK